MIPINYKISSLFVLIFQLLACSLSIPTSIDDTSRVIHGYVVDISEVPYTALIKIQRTPSATWDIRCGASIVTEKALVTGAKCKFSDDVSKYRVLTEATFKDNDDKCKINEVEKFIAHELFNRNTSENDVAVIVTKNNIALNDKAQLIPIAPENIDLPAGTETLLAGYGVSRPFVNVLLAASLEVIDQDVCKKAYNPISVYDSMICALGANPLRGSCYGDAGGPLVAKGYLVGIVSWGAVNCANPKRPGVYTRVSKYHSWIKNKLSNV